MTEVELPAARGMIAHGRRILTIGSCFADEIGAKMADDLFDVTVNPFGALYNPLSILRAFRLMEEAPEIKEDSLISSQDLWHSPDFHSRFSSPDRGELASWLTIRLKTLHELLPEFDTVIVTLGSARAFLHKATGTVAANCHKLPASEFTLFDITPEETADALTEIQVLLRRHNPNIKLVVTVSPIRHKAYGLHTDRLSKARLLLGADIFCRIASEAVIYFPAYELLQDELRDYRFYADDMIHPSTAAVNHIYECFGRSFFSEETADLAARAHKIVMRLRHRPLNPATAEATRAGAVEAARQFAGRYPAVGRPLGEIVSTTLI